MTAVRRCAWAGDDPLMVAYHDEEWGMAEHHDRRLFELITLEGAQAGLSWTTILRKRDGYRRAFAGFDPEVVAQFDASDVDRLLLDASIVRHRGKIESTIANAAQVLEVQRDVGSLDTLVWSFVDGAPIVRARRVGRAPSQTDESRAEQGAETPQASLRRPTTVCASCRPPAWSTTTTRPASATAGLAGAEPPRATASRDEPAAGRRRTPVGTGPRRAREHEHPTDHRQPPAEHAEELHADHPERRGAERRHHDAGPRLDRLVERQDPTVERHRRVALQQRLGGHVEERHVDAPEEHAHGTPAMARRLRPQVQRATVSTTDKP